MTARWVAVHRTDVVGAALGIWGTGLATFFGLLVGYNLDFFGPLGGPWVVGFGAFAVTGALITWHRPSHVIGLLFLVLGLTAPLANTILALAMGPFAEHSFALRAIFVAVASASTTAIFPLLTLVLALFPDGRLLSSRWRWLPWTAAVATVLGAAAAFGAGAWGGDHEQALLGPPLDGRLSAIAQLLSPLFFLLVIVLLGGGASSVVVRYRRSRSVARQQMKWLVAAVLVIALLTAALVLTQGTVRALPGTSALLMASAIALVPVSAGIAILRHRLYDVDLVLNRTIVVGLLAVFVTALYVGLVVGVGSLIGDRTNVVLTVGATAVVAGAFEPVRARVQHWANVAVYGPRATPYEVLAAISDELGAAGDADDQLAAMAGLLADGTGAAHVTVWVNVDGVLRPAACAPPHHPPGHPDLPADEGFAEPPGAGHRELVRLDGELLGALSLERSRDEPFTPHERRLLTEMAGQAALVLGHARLRARLTARIEELRSSRRRLVAAQDEARRKLERNLHDGAQQQLVALKIKLGLARTIAAKEGAGEAVGELLGALTTAADEVVATLRSLARGIYPPLLEAEGLERALASQAHKAPGTVNLTVAGIGRYGREVEATVYFCVLEALRNTLTRAGGHAAPVAVSLAERDGTLVFEVVEVVEVVQGGGSGDPPAPQCGLELTPMRDRCDAVGGTVTIDRAAGGGVRVIGSIPAVAQVPAGHAAAVRA